MFFMYFFFDCYILLLYLVFNYVMYLDNLFVNVVIKC